LTSEFACRASDYLHLNCSFLKLKKIFSKKHLTTVTKTALSTTMNSTEVNPATYANGGKFGFKLLEEHIVICIFAQQITD